jgi:hypothetical protein
MIKDFVIEYAKMLAHRANITAEKYKTQDFKLHQFTNRLEVLSALWRAPALPDEIRLM